MLYCKISITSFIINRKNAILFYCKRIIGAPTNIKRNYTYSIRVTGILIYSSFTVYHYVMYDVPVNHSDNNELLIKNKHVTYKNYNYDIPVSV